MALIGVWQLTSVTLTYLQALFLSLLSTQASNFKKSELRDGNSPNRAILQPDTITILP